MRFVGIDLAWSLRHTHLPDTGGVVLDDTGRVIAESHLTTDAAIIEFISDNIDSDGCVVGIDAPLVVPNEVGYRRCEHELQTVGISAHSSNRTLFKCVHGGIRGEDIVALLARDGFVLTSEVARKQATREIIEIYPYAFIRRTFDVAPRYKKKKRVTTAMAADGMIELQELILTRLDPPLIWPKPPVKVATVAELRPGELKRRGDLLDAALSAYLGYLAWYGGPERVETVGSITDGFIMLPRS